MSPDDIDIEAEAFARALDIRDRLELVTDPNVRAVLRVLLQDLAVIVRRLLDEEDE